MKLFQMLIACFMLLFSEASFARGNKDVSDYLSLNQEISSIHKVAKNKSKETAVDDDILFAINSALALQDHLRLKETPQELKVLEVVATAYTSHAAQTDSTPTIAAWGDRLKPSTKAIAVSRDLLTEYGLKHRSKVRIKGLSGEYLVLDKMNKRWRKKIDIYMGMNRKAAFKWGKRRVVLSWRKDAV
ncbi:MAG TPA: hypothetical protein EYG68_02605 [Leucothrix mucor]|nr:hypothetical protein [Leucothrix mucor]